MKTNINDPKKNPILKLLTCIKQLPHYFILIPIYVHQ
jgi:hypothetical protein